MRHTTINRFIGHESSSLASQPKENIMNNTVQRTNWLLHRAKPQQHAIAESSFRTLEHHLREEQKWKLCLLEQLSTGTFFEL
jgi:hypothetical protein